MTHLQITPTGAFSLREAAMFGFGQRHLDTFDGVLRLAMCADGSYEPFAAAVRQAEDGSVQVELQAPPGQEQAAGRQIARVLSLDHDGRVFDAVAAADPVLAGLVAVAPGLRPPLFHSAYEAAVWAVLNARLQTRQAMALRRRLEQHGTTFQVAGQDIAALPGPAGLLALTELPGLPAEKLLRLHGVARAALDGVLDVQRLRALEPAQAATQLQTLRGIGPFSAELVVVRALGHADVLPTTEPTGMALVGELYGLGGPATAAQLEGIAERWRPYRTWAFVLVRAATGRLPQRQAT